MLRRGDEVRHVAVGALGLYRLRLVDLTIREHVLIFHIVEGREYVRANAGVLHFYSNGSFVPYEGLIQETPSIAP